MTQDRLSPKSVKHVTSDLISLQINSYIKSLGRNYPGLAETEFVGHSFEGREIWMIKISSDRSANKPVFMVESGMHAREWAGPATALYLIHELVENHTNSGYALRELDYYIIPLVNPDGYEYSHTTVGTKHFILLT